MRSVFCDITYDMTDYRFRALGVACYVAAAMTEDMADDKQHVADITMMDLCCLT